MMIPVDELKRCVRGAGFLLGFQREKLLRLVVDIERVGGVVCESCSGGACDDETVECTHCEYFIAGVRILKEGERVLSVVDNVIRRTMGTSLDLLPVYDRMEIEGAVRELVAAD